MPRRPLIAAPLLAGALLAAPLTITGAPPAPKKTSEPAGIVITVEGIGGMDLFGHVAGPTFRRAGLPHEVRRFIWTHGKGKHLKDLQDTGHMVRKADELAVMIRELRADEPKRPIYIVARSGGAGLTLYALEALPPGSVDRVVFLAAAVSPNHDLRPALRAIKHELVTFHSPFDQLVLNLGTRRFGTADRHYGPSAGLHGFVTPTNLDAEGRALYARLVQVPWQSRMLLRGNTGSHFGSSLPSFLAAEVGPWLHERGPNRQAPARAVLAPPEALRRGERD